LLQELIAVSQVVALAALAPDFFVGEIMIGLQEIEKALRLGVVAVAHLAADGAPLAIHGNRLRDQRARQVFWLIAFGVGPFAFRTIKFY
jgi:hypothetical protein